MKQYYYVTEAGEQEGPVTIEGLRVAGIGRDTLVWCEGMADWAEAEQLPELAEFFVEAMPCPPPPPRRRPRATGSDSDTQTASSAGDDVPPSIPNGSGTVNGANAVPSAASVYSGGSHGAAPAQTKRNPVWLVFAGVFFLVFIGITLFSVLSLHNQRIEDENALVVVDPEEIDAPLQISLPAEDQSQEDTRIKYDYATVESGWTALYDKRKQKRCYMTREDYYSINEPCRNGNLKEEYSYLQPLGIVLKFPGAKIIWGFESIGPVSWNDANQYVNGYSPDGFEWKLLSTIEASAIIKHIYEFDDCIQPYYPNDFSYSGMFGYTHCWTSALSDEVYRRADGKTYNYVYILSIYFQKGEIKKGGTTYEGDKNYVYPISLL